MTSADLSSSVYLITGAAGFLGSCISQHLASLGANLILVDHPQADSTRLVDLVSSFNGDFNRALYSDLSPS